MEPTNLISEKRQKLIDEKKLSPLTVGETISVKYNSISSFKQESKKDQSISCTIISLENGIHVRRNDDKREQVCPISVGDIASRKINDIGANPFPEIRYNVTPVSYLLQSILFNLNILKEKYESSQYKLKDTIVKELNWNPFVYNSKNEKEYYQRPFVWTIDEKQNLIESIYQGIDCGKILVRKRSFEELEKMAEKGETELAFKDLIDGKQRLDAIRGFIELEYPDAHGNYFNDLSAISQGRFTDHQLFSYAEMPENSKDSDVIAQFLKLNFAGVPQSKEHIEFVRAIQKNI